MGEAIMRAVKIISRFYMPYKIEFLALRIVFT